MNFLTNLLGIFGGGFNSIFGLVTSTMKEGFQAAIRFHKEGIAFARDMGMSAKQAQAYTDVLIQRTQVLANKYGVSAEAILQVQRNLSEATGKQLMLNDAQAEGFVQINKLVGAQTTSKFTEEIMNGMGGQIDTVQGAISKVYATAAKQGLNAKKLTDKVAQNLSMANRLSFRDGVNGLTRMAAYAEKVGMNMSSVETAAGQFLELDKAIENAAQMQMLGGSAAANFGNPLTAAYEANYDPEAFAKRMSDSLGSYATFDATKGVSSINGMNMDFVRNIAKTMGISVDEASKMAKKQAEVRYKENTLGGTLDRVAGGDEARRNYILNNAQVTNNGQDLEIHGKNINEITEKEWEDMMHFEGMTDKEIMAEQAQTLTSIDEHISGAADSVVAAFAKGIDKYLPGIGKQIQGLGNFFQGFAEQWGADTGKVVGKAMHWLSENGETIANVASSILTGITKLISLAAEYTKTAIGIFLGWKFGKWLLSGSMSGMGGGIGGAAKGALGGMKKVGSALVGGSKVAKVGGALLGAGLGAFNAISSYRSYKDKKKELGEQLKSGAISQAEYNSQVNEARQEKNASVGEGVGTAIGAVAGAAIAGPLGAAIGGWLGGEGGKLIGKHWDEIENFAKGAWETTKNFAKGVWDSIKNLASGVWESTKSIAKSVWDTIPLESQAVISKAWDIAAGAAKGYWEVMKGVAIGAWDVIKGVAVGIWDVVKGVAVGTWDVVKGAALGAWSVIKGSVLGVWEVIKGAGLGIWEVVKGLWNGLWDVINAPFKAIGDIVSGIWNGFGQIFDGNILDGIMTIFGGIGSGIWDIVSAPFIALGDIFGGLGKGILKFASGVISGIGEFVKGIWRGIGRFVSGIWDGIKEVASGIWNGIGEVASGVWNGIADVASGVWNAIGDVASGIWTGIGEFANGIWNGFLDLGGGAWGAIKEKAGEIWSGIGDIASKVWNGIGDIASTIWHGIGDVANTVWEGIKGFAKSAWDGIANIGATVWYGFLKVLNKIPGVNFDIPEEYRANGGIVGNGYASGGVVPGTSYSGDKIITGLNSGEMVLNKTQQANLFGLANQPQVKSKPVVGENAEYIYKPNSTETSNVNGNTITVKDFNINLSGTLRLDGGNTSKNIDMNALLNDYQFMNALKEMIKTSINNDMNGGRFMNDLATLRGQVSSSSIIGR